MMETLRLLVALGLTGLLLLLRLDAPAFGIAELGATGVAGRTRGGRAGEEEASALPWPRRLSWYALAVALLATVAALHPSPGLGLHLQVGNGPGAVLAGLAYGMVGIAASAGLARWRSGELGLPSLRGAAAPVAVDVVEGLASAAVDEALFRGVVLGWSLAAVASIGRDPMLAILLVALVDLLVTRAATPGRGVDALTLRLGVAVVGGWLTVVTAGIGAAVLGHALTRLGLVVLAGRPAPGAESGRRGWGG